MNQTEFESTAGVATTTDRFNVSRGQLIYATWLIALISLFEALNRSGLSILIQPIKAELGFSDTQIGVLTGFAFTLTYAAFSIPLARIADTGSRVRLLSVCLAVWSIATALAGLVTGFVQMALTRIVVGAAQAGSPASMSMLSDYYPPETRARGMSWYLMGGILGGSVGLAAVGFIAEQYGWRVAFYAIGLPGIGVALLVLWTLREPARGRFQNASFDTDINWWQAVQEVLRRRTMRHLIIAFTIMTFGGSGAGAWLGAFFMRSHGLSLSEAGSLLGIVMGVGTLAGTFLGVLFAPWLVGRDRRWELWWPGATNLVYLPLYMVALYVDNIVLAAALLVVASILGGSSMGMILSAIQSILPAHVRATGLALIMFATNFIGAGAGPLLVGVASDAMAPQFGDDGLRYALMIGIATVGWGVVHFFVAAKHFNNDLVS